MLKKAAQRKHPSPSALPPVLLSALLAWTGTILAPERVGALEFDRIEGSTLYFKPEAGKTPTPLTTQLVNPSYLGKVTAEGTEYFVLESSSGGMPFLYLLRADGGKQHQFVHPGRIIDPKSGTTVWEGWGFFGKCVSGKEDVLVVYQKEQVDKRRRGRVSRRTEMSEMIIEPEHEVIRESSPKLVRYASTLEQKKRFARNRVKTKQCTEIDGKHRKMAAQMMSIKPSREEESEREEDEEEPSSDQGADGQEAGVDASGEQPAAREVSED